MSTEKESHPRSCIFAGQLAFLVSVTAWFMRLALAPPEWVVQMFHAGAGFPPQSQHGTSSFIIAVQSLGAMLCVFNLFVCRVAKPKVLTLMKSKEVLTLMESETLEMTRRGTLLQHFVRSQGRFMISVMLLLGGANLNDVLCWTVLFILPDVVCETISRATAVDTLWLTLEITDCTIKELHKNVHNRYTEAHGCLSMKDVKTIGFKQLRRDITQQQLARCTSTGDSHTDADATKFWIDTSLMYLWLRQQFQEVWALSGVLLLSTVTSVAIWLLPCFILAYATLTSAKSLALVPLIPCIALPLVGMVGGLQRAANVSAQFRGTGSLTETVAIQMELKNSDSRNAQLKFLDLLRNFPTGVILPVIGILDFGAVAKLGAGFAIVPPLFAFFQRRYNGLQ